MPAYMIALNKILDQEAWAEYHKAMPSVILGNGVTPHSGGAFVQRLEGDESVPCDYMGMLEFRDMEHLRSFLDSPEYKETLPLAAKATSRIVFAFEELPIGVS